MNFFELQLSHSQERFVNLLKINENKIESTQKVNLPFFQPRCYVNSLARLYCRYSPASQ